MAYIGPANSVITFQGTVPWSVLGAVTTTGSVISVNQGSIAAVIIGGSVAGVANQSVSGTVTVNQGANAGLGSSWPIKISNGTQTANVTASSMLSVTVDNSPTISGSVAAVIIGGSIAASFTPPVNQSVSGTVGASIIGLTPVAVTNTPSISGTVNIGIIPGSILAFQGGTWTQSVVGQGAAAALTNGWPIINGEANDSTGTFTNATQTTSITNNNLDGYGNTLISINGTYGTATAIFEGSDDSGVTWYTVAAARDDLNVIETGYTSLTNVSRTWQINNSGFDSIRVRSTAVASGTVTVRISSSSAPNSSGATVGIGTALPAGTNVIGAVAASISGTVLVTGSVQQGTTPWAIAGSVAAFQAGTIITSVAGQVTVVSSLVGGIFPISGSVAAVVTNTVNVNTAGSVVAFQGTNPWVVQSIVGTYAEDAPSASGDKGFLVMGARNDTLASVTSNDGDYSSHVVGPAGELIAANAPFTKWVQGNTIVTSGGSVALIVAQGSSVFTYLTSLQISNTTATNALVTFQGASSSVIGYAPAPGNGGAVFTIPNAWKTNANGAITASINAAASVFISGSGFISKT